MRTATEIQHLPGTWEEFLHWEPNDGYKYEWNDGELIRFEHMKQRHLDILRTLGTLFFRTEAFQKRGWLAPEQDVMLTGIQMRRPDLAYFSGEQIDASPSAAEGLIPAFVIEVISPTDDAIKVEEKLDEYFKCGVQVVWHAYPQNGVVYVYTSRKKADICMEEDICSARPVLPDFEISVNDLFFVSKKN